MCQNTTLRVYGARIKRYCVLCSKHIAVRDKPPGGARICETGLLSFMKTFFNPFYKFACYSMVNWSLKLYMNDILFIQRLIYEASPYTQLTWLHGQARTIPQGAVIGSHTRDGAPLYVIKADSRAGNYDARNSFAEYEYNGAKSTTNFEYLVLYFCAYLLLVILFVCLFIVAYQM